MTQRNIGHYSSSGPVDRRVSNGARTVIVRSQIERRVEVVYLLDVVSSGRPCHALTRELGWAFYVFCFCVCTRQNWSPICLPAW
jgi:hypothetical protein